MGINDTRGGERRGKADCSGGEGEEQNTSQPPPALSDIGENWILQGRGVKLISRASKDLSQSHSGLGIKLPCPINVGKTKFVNM